MDRRVSKTREAIFTAFVALLREKEYERISINEIAERANVNRGTVYLHFVDKVDLLDQCMDIYLQQLYASCFPEDAALPPAAPSALLHTLTYLERHSDLYTLLLTNKGTLAFRSRLTKIIIQSIEEQITAIGLPAGTNREIMAQFLSSAIVGLLEWWIVNAMPYPAATLAEQLTMLLLRHLPMPAQAADEPFHP